MELLTEHQLNSLSRLSYTPHPIEEEQICLLDLSYSDLNDIQKAKLVTLIKQYPQVFTEKLGRTHLVKHVIELQPGTQSANTQPYRLPPSKKAIVDQQLEEMLQAGHITPSHSPWTSPIVLSPKKDGTLRFCVDYRKLNANTIRTAYPMPQIYPLSLIVSKPAGLTLKASKCDYCRKELKYLGHIITPDGIKPDPGLIDSVKLFPQPTRLKDIQSFLGLTGYYRKFIKDYAKIRSHQKSKRSPNNIEWSVECTIAFEQLKTALTQAPILRGPNFNEPFILETDACDYGLGAVLTQEYDNKKFVIAYASRTQTTAERNYFPTEKEALAIYWATKHFRPYLEGTKSYIRSDCRALQWLLETKDSSGRLARWAISLSAFNIVSIKYKPGKTNTNSDSLSRYPLSNLAVLNGTTPISTLNFWDNCTLLENIRIEQYKDPHLHIIIDKLSGLSHPFINNLYPSFTLINGILYKCRSPSKNIYQRSVGLPHLLVIPKSMQQELLSWTHDHPTAGHSVNETTGDTPAYLNFGRDPKLPPHLLLTTPTHDVPLLPTSLSSEIENYKQQLRHQLLTSHQFAQEHSEVCKFQQKHQYDSHSFKRSFKEGQLVWVSIPSVLKHGKLDPQYQGPCHITQVLTPSSFIIQRLSDGVNLGVANIDRLKPFYEPNDIRVNNTRNTPDQTLNTHPQPLMSIDTSNAINMIPSRPSNNDDLSPSTIISTSDSNT
ncbi:unnamed protein product [Rotaria sp. Silwood1]|nr:unnamed protein product [Rotaria sp. Silwood1]CAF1637584.1 unnamed protein product [Rotaria sp. Silwood1]